MQAWCGAWVHVPVHVGNGGQGAGRCTICCLALCPYMCVSLYEYVGTCMCMRVCVHMDVVAAGNPDMLKGAKGQAACTALAKSLPACSLLEKLDLAGERRGKAWA